MKPVKPLPREAQLLLGAGVLLVVDTFLPWQNLSLGSFSYSWNAWHGVKGVLLGVLTIALLVWALLVWLAPALGLALPARVADGPATLALGVLVFVFAAVKNIRDDYSAWGSYVGVVLAAGVAAGAWLTHQRSGSSLPDARTSGSRTWA